MKKRISIILVITILLSMLNCVTTSALVYYPLEEIGECSLIEGYNQSLILYYNTGGEKYPLTYYYSDEEVEYIVDFFSDKNLVNTGKTFNTLGGSSIADFEVPSVGSTYFHIDTDETCLLYFDEKEVFFIKRGMGTDENGEYGSYVKQAMFTYKDESTYQEFERFLLKEVDEYIEQKRIEEEQKRLEREETIKKQEDAQGKWFDENAVYITDFKEIYSATFDATDIDFFDVMKNGEWGLCSYKRIGENQTTVVPFTWNESINGIDYYFIGDAAPYDNKVSLGLEYMLVINNNENYAYYTPTDEAPDCYFEINVTDDLRTSDISYKAYEDGKLWQTGKLDMTTYEETGTLPKEYFSPDNNIQEVEKEEEKEPEKVETVDVKQYVHDTVMEENISEELKDEQSYSVSWRINSEDVVYSSNQNDWRAENKKSLIINRVSQIYDFIEKNGTQIDRSAYMKRFREIFPFNNELSDNPAKTYACIKIVGTGVKVFTLTVYDEYVEIEMKNQHTGECQYEYHKVSDANALLEYISDISFMGFAPAKEEIVIDNIDIKNKTINSKPLKVVETYSFKVDVDQNSYKSIYKELAELGEKIECTLTHVMPESGNDSKSYFILEMKGSKATRSFYTAYGSALHYGKCELYFNKNRVYENNQLKNVKSNKPSWTLEFYGTAKNGEVNAVVLSYEFTNPLSTVNRNSSKEFYGNTVCQDFEYEFLLDEYEWNKNKNIPYMITFDEDEEWMDKKEAYNKRKALGITYDMFRVNALAHVRLDIDDAVAPDWYKELGKNVNLMILSVSSETRFGRTTAPMLRLRGAGGEIWFDYSGINHIDFPNEELHFSWKANVGFDPTRSDEDHTVEGKLSGKILCSGGMDSVVESIELYIGGETYKFGINEFNVIGCDVLTRDLMYRRTADYQKAYWDELDDFMSNMKYGYVYRY